MKSTGTFIVAMMLGVAAALGTSAALHTVHLGAAASKAGTVPDRVIADRMAKLKRAEVSLRQALAKRPPKLPRVPHFKPVQPPPTPAAAPAPTAAPAPHVIYQRPPPIIIHKHRAGAGDDGHDHEGGHDGGGGDD